MSALSSVLAAQIATLPEFQAATIVLIYLATPEEVNLESLCEGEVSKMWVVPRIAPGRRLTLHRFQPGMTALQHGMFGIREPEENAASVEPESIDLVLVPALMASERGERLGYGGGYYDRLLPQLHADCTRIVVLPEALVRPELPTDPWDQPLDILVTEARILRPIHR